MHQASVLAPVHADKSYLFAYQPILDRNRTVVAQEFLYRRQRESGAQIDCPTEATATVIINAFAQYGTSEFLKRRKAFVNVGEDMLLSDMITLLPRSQVVIELLETSPISRELVDRCHKLKAMGFSFALDDFVGVDYYEPLLDVVDIVKVDLLQMAPEQLAATVRRLKRWPVQLLAEKVETVDDFERCKALGFDLFQGYHFARPAPVVGKRADPAKLAVLDLLGKINRDLDDQQLEKAFKENVGLYLNLLRLVNSAAFASQAKITSIRHAITILGRRQLTRWLQLLLFTLEDKGEHPSALFEAAARRGRFMELLMEGLAGFASCKKDQAYMAGVLSMADALLLEPMDKLVAKLCLADEVSLALTDRQGLLGKLLQLCCALETADFDAVDDLALQLRVAPDDVTKAQDQALAWVCQLGYAATG
ncbi:EAL and HDOD domain-containing protein [Azospira restricta]|uniref:EAL domain-containing protein n=1 Tax=Azospira restricta TaxID=404405 RepID=A0A974SP27_9RHOO|nr:EAL domain-containing protein [Azospira restricta]QRJ63823.1 EAL domain-containing protein [Azospira restricta]